MLERAPVKVVIGAMLSVALMIPACNGSATIEPSTVPSLAQPSESAVPTAESSATQAPTPSTSLVPSLGDIPIGAVITIELNDGPDAGSHEVTAPTPACVRVGDRWSIQFSNTTEEGLSHLLLSAPFADGRASELGVVATFGSWNSPDTRVYEVRVTSDSVTDTGTGSVTVIEAGDTATVTMKGATKHGTQIDLTVSCARIMTIPSDLE